jgi:DNA repair photolyase
MRDESTATGASGPPRLIHVARRGPVLRPSPKAEGVYGLDLTAGCLHGCGFCHIRGSARYPGDARVLFDPFSAEALGSALDELGEAVRRVVLSPGSDPLPLNRGVRAEAVRAAEAVLNRGVELVVMTRGRVPRALLDVLASHPGRASIALGLTTLSKPLSRALEPRAASPRGRLRDLARLSAAGIEVEARVEPLIAGLTDTRENLLPLFRALSAAGVGRVVAHYLFLHPSMTASLTTALEPLGHAERLIDEFEGGPTFALGTIGTTKHLPREARRTGLARLIAWGAECGLAVSTGSAQNPDLPRLEPPRLRTAPAPPVAEPAPAV